MPNITKRLFVFYFFAVLGFVFYLQGIAVADEYVGEIVIGDDDAMTGPYAATTYCHVEAAQDYWEQRNNTITVDGKKYKIKHLLTDNKGDVSLTISNFKRFVQEGAVIVRVNWTPGMLACLPLAKKKHVPIIYGAYARKLVDPPNDYVFLCNPSYPEALVSGIKWYKENVWKGPGKMKVGLLLWDNGYGRASDLKELYDYLKEDLGVEVVPTQFFPYKVKNFTPQLLRFKKQGVNLIAFQALAGQFAMLTKDAYRLKVTPNIALMSNYWCLSDKFLELTGETSEGIYGIWPHFIDKSDDIPENKGANLMHDAMEKYRGNRYYDVNYYEGYKTMYVIQHLIEMTIKKHGYPITGEQVAQTAVTMPAWDDWGFSRSFSGYKGGDRLGWHEVRVHQVKDGKVVTVSDWVETPPEFLSRVPWLVGKGK